MLLSRPRRASVHLGGRCGPRHRPLEPLQHLSRSYNFSPFAHLSSNARKPVVALIFPKSAGENPSHLDRLQVLGAFEPELGGDSQPYRGTPLGREGLPIEIKCQDRLWLQCAGHVDAGRIPIETSEAHKGCAKVCSDPLKKCSQWHPAPAPDLAPALDADMASDLLDLRQHAQRRDCPGSLF